MAAARSLAIIYSDMVRSEGARWLSSPSVEYALLETNEISIQCLQVTDTAASCSTERRRLISSPSAAALP